jgi:hypothetical protein
MQDEQQQDRLRHSDYRLQQILNISDERLDTENVGRMKALLEEVGNEN